MPSQPRAALAERYQRLADPRDLDSAIVAMSKAVDGTEPIAPDRPAWEVNLALLLRDRYERDGDLADLDRPVAEL